ncbi:hypothetical protein BH11PLA2_BH11PLA2_47410 [soil metagenome]
MPILAAEPDLYPATLLETPPATSGVWFVAMTRPRQEKSLARDLFSAGIAFFSPCTPRRNLVRGRIVISRIPLFAGYVFIRGLGPDRARVLLTNRVLQLLTVPDPERLEADLRQVWCLTGTGRPLMPAERLDVGTPVQIREGPMAGLKGRVIRTSGMKRFVVAVDFLGSGVAVELEAETLARLPVARSRPELSAGALR